MQETNSKKDSKKSKTLLLNAKNKVSAKSKIEKEAKTISPNKEKKPGLKLPIFSKFRPKASHIIIAVFLVVFLAFFARVAIWEHNYLAAMEGSERDVVTSGDGEVYEGGDEVDTTKPTEKQIA